MPLGESTTNATGTGAQAAPSFEEEIDLARYIQPLVQHWKLLLAGAVIGVAGGLVVSMRQPTLYEAVSTVLVQQQSASPAAFSTSRALLRNFTLAGETVKELGLDAPPYNLTPQSFVEGVLTVEEVPGTALIRVKTKLSDPVLAAKACGVIADKAVELNRKIALQGNTDVRNQLKVLLDAASDRLKNAEQELVAHQSSAQVDLLRSDTDAMLSAREGLTRLLVQIEAEKSRLAAAEAELAKQSPLLTGARSVAAEDALRRALQEEARQAAAAPLKREDQERLRDRGKQAKEPSAAEQKKADDSSSRSERADRSARQSGDARETSTAAPDSSELLDLSSPYINPVYQTLVFDIARSRARLAGMERERRELASTRGLGRAHFDEFARLYRGEVETARLQNNYDVAEHVYNEIALKYEQTRTESLGSMVQLQIVDRAFVPDRPMPRKRVQTAALGMAVGLVLAAFAALVINLDFSRPGRRAPRAL